MKRLIAIIRPIMRDDVIAALHRVENFPGAAMSEISGIRRGIHQQIKEHREQLTVDFPRYIRLEIVCTDAMLTVLMETIQANARTGKPGDGKIFVAPVESTLSISDGLIDDEAL